MRPFMHIPDGFLAPQVALALWVATAVVVGISVRRIATGDRELDRGTRPILMGLVGAFIFAAQMFNFPVASGTSGHLLGGVLAGYLLGPWAGTVVMSTVIGTQALLFQDGGLLALGANIFNMGIIGTLGGTFLARAIATAIGGGRTATILSAGVAGWFSVMAGAGFTTLQLGLSGTTNIAIGLPAMLGVHALIGIGEALITVAALQFIATTAPDILTAQPLTATSMKRRIATGLSAAMVVAVLASIFASAEPDGLNKVAESLGFSGKEQTSPFNLFAGYAIPGLDGTGSTIVAAFLGIAFVASVLIALSKIASRRQAAK